jgi:hypothetical protein
MNIAERAAADVALRIKLERPFSAQVKKFLLEIYDANYRLYRNTGQIIGTQNLLPEMEGILTDNYLRIYEAFRFRTLNEILKRKAEPTAVIERPLAASMAAYISVQAEKQGRVILKNIETEMTNLTARVKSNMTASGSEISRDDIAVEVRGALVDSSEGKSDIIAITETLGTAEKTKHTEAEIIAASAVILGISSKIIKTWSALLDSKTRPEHARADGQSRRAGEPFIVAGEALQFPGDTAGSIGNIANCRCVLSYGAGG